MTVVSTSANLDNLLRACGLYLVLGGARSGKSAYGEEIANRLATGANDSLCYIATWRSSHGDIVMSDRIARHRERRTDKWNLVEEGIELAQALRQSSKRHNIVLVDCLSIWLSNLMQDNENIYQRINELTNVLQNEIKTCILITNEVGLGVVPHTDSGCLFRDLNGELNASVASVVDRVFFVIAGLGLVLK